MLGFEDFFLSIYNKRLHFLLISIDIDKMFWWWRSSHTFVFVSFNFCSVYVTIIRLGCLTRRLCVKQTLNHTASPSERTCVGVSQWVRGDGRGSDVAGQCGGVWPPTSAHQTSVCLCFPAGHQPAETEVTEERQLWSGPARVMTEVVTIMSPWHHHHEFTRGV